MFCHLRVLILCETNVSNSSINFKEGQHKGKFQQVFYSLTSTFLKWTELLLPFTFHKNFPHCGVSIVIFDGFCLIFLHKLARFLRFQFQKIWRFNIYYLISRTCQGIVMNLHLCKDSFLQINLSTQLIPPLQFSFGISMLYANDIELLIEFQVLFQLY